MEESDALIQNLNEDFVENNDLLNQGFVEDNNLSLREIMQGNIEIQQNKYDNSTGCSILSNGISLLCLKIAHTVKDKFGVYNRDPVEIRQKELRRHRNRNRIIRDGIREKERERQYEQIYAQIQEERMMGRRMILQNLQNAN